jgi:hypothetical protein
MIAEHIIALEIVALFGLVLGWDLGKFIRDRRRGKPLRRRAGSGRW